MRIKSLSPLLLGATVTSTKPPRPELVTIVRGTFAIVPGGTVAELDGPPLIAQGPLEADTFREGDEERTGELIYASDFADFKLNAEVLLTGSCHAPHGRPVTECLVRFAVGAWSKALRVIGDRQFTATGISDPQPFTTMPLDYAHAFGGAGHAENPVGKGMDGKELPNVEHPKGLVHARSDRPEPGSFAPRSPFWPPRNGKRGTKYDLEYLRTRSPYYAEDFDWTYFHAAPDDQQIEGYLRGDEEIALHNLHPTEPVVTTRLPGLRPRVFVQDSSERAREVLVRLDTVHVDVDKLRVTLTWRGLTLIGEHDRSDVKFALIASEKLADAPLPASHYLAALARFAKDPIGLADAIPPELRDALAKSDAEADAPSADLDPVSRMLANKLGKMNAEEQASIRQAIARAAEEMAPGVDLREKLREIVEGSEAPAAPPAVVPPAVGGRPRVYIREGWLEARARLEEARRQATARGAEPEGLREAEEKLRDPKLLAVDPTLRDPTEDLPARGADLSGQDLSGHDLSGLDLSGAKLEGAVLIGTSLRRTNLAGASLSGAMLFKADFSLANLRNADLSVTNAANAIFEEADLRGARIDDAFFQDANLKGARLEGASGKFVTFAGADLTGARANGMKLDEADLSKAKLDEADLSDSAICRSRLLHASLKKADLRRAKLDRSSTMDADLSGARLGGARGEQTIWLRAKLDGADFSLSWFRGAFFSEASAKGANFHGADLRDARLDKVSLEGASFLQANLFGANLQSAKLGNTSFAKANLYEAKLLYAAGPNTTFEGANIQRVVFSEKA
jgi:uncharacterized protein YjbI with pentapeptide repeats